MNKFDTTVNFINNHVRAGGYAAGVIIDTLGYSTIGAVGGAKWKSTGNTITANQDPITLDDIKLSDASGNEFELVVEEAGIIDLNVLGGTSAGFVNIATAAGLTFSQGLTSDISDDVKSFDTLTNAIAGVALLAIGNIIYCTERTAGNGGEAHWTCVDATTVTENEEDIVTGNATISFVLIVPEQLNVKALGLLTSNTAAANVSIINRTMAISGNIIFPDRNEIYSTDPRIGSTVLPPSNTILTFAKGVTLQAIDVSDDNYRVIYINNVVNVKIFGGIFRGDKDTHLGSTGEGGHSIGVFNSSDISLFGSEGHDSWGVGLAIVDVSDFYGEDIFCSNGRQNCAAIIKGKNVELIRSRFVSASGTAPAAGIDIEPNLVTDTLEGIRLIDCITENNEGVGINIALGFFKDSDQNVDITIINHVDRGSLTGFWVAQLQESSTGSVDGSINYINGTTFDNEAAGILISNYAARTTPKIFIDSPTIYRPNNAETGQAADIAGIAFDRAIAFTNTNLLGNIHVRNPTIIDNRATVKMVNAINITDFKNIGYENCIIEDPIICKGVVGGDIANVNNIIKLDSGVTFTNKFNVASIDVTSSLVMSANSAYGLVTNRGATGIISVVLPGLTSSLINPEIETVVIEAELIRIIPTSANILPLSAVSGKYIQSTGKGGSVILQKVADDEWFIKSIIGTWSVEA